MPHGVYDRSLTSEQKFWVQVNKTNTCWLWTGYIPPSGYGLVCFKGKVRNAHRVAYTLVKGAVPRGLDLDHLCRTKACVNPDHLEPVTHAENMRRWSALRRQQAA